VRLIHFAEKPTYHVTIHHANDKLLQHHFLASFNDISLTTAKKADSAVIYLKLPKFLPAHGFSVKTTIPRPTGDFPASFSDISLKLAKKSDSTTTFLKFPKVLPAHDSLLRARLFLNGRVFGPNQQFIKFPARKRFSQRLFITP
jgi:hypothetical protein